MAEEIVNRVKKSRTKLLDLEDYYTELQLAKLDIVPFLYEGLILREQEFRKSADEFDWRKFEGKFVRVFCSADAIVPTWAYMLVASKLSPIASGVGFGSDREFKLTIFEEIISSIDFSQYDNERVIIKGCSKVEVPENVYLRLTAKLQPFAKSIMFGEPCSTVPVYKKPRK
ncbi:DUF2480 family protein [Salibacter sp.]|uniref:DUF2480 family protein n=1 Tax=Salibacter sp. TaxID=2010995 RepID=UPI0028704405|nr:DUF2480 family protein [Salibacter sp.]MDR9397612.1 DUF2480 family protein [Salibacter sp.]MDR9486767.1 DUF2480 family protein [Salibacter sp.]